MGFWGFGVLVDDAVGQIMERLGELGIKENTMVIFTSDNGCSPMADFDELAAVDHSPSYWYRGHKADIFEGGHRVPFIVSWPEKINAGQTSDQLLCMTDFMATASELVGDTLAANEGEDSFSFLHTLFDEPSIDTLKRPSIVHHSINGSFALRRGKWKMNFCPGSGGWSAPVPKDALAQNLPSVHSSALWLSG